MSVSGRLGVALLRLSHAIRSSIPAVIPARGLVDLNAHTFGRMAPSYVELVDAGLFDIERALLDRYRVNAGRALCLGCGAGREVFPLAVRGLDVHGVDQVPELLDHAAAAARARGLRVTLTQADYTRFDAPAGSYDYVFALNCAYTYVPGRRRRVEMLARVHGLLAPGGLCMLSYICREPTAREARSHRIWRRLARLAGNRGYEPGDRLMPDDTFAHYFFSDDEVRLEAEAAGFQRVEFDADGASHFAVLFP